MTFEFKIKNTKNTVFSIVLERKYELTVLNLNSKIMSKHIFPHFYSLEAPVLWRPHRRKLALSRKHFRNVFFNEMNEMSRPVIQQVVVNIMKMIGQVENCNQIRKRHIDNIVNIERKLPYFFFFGQTPSIGLWRVQNKSQPT
jgi:hypothetical protein